MTQRTQPLKTIAFKARKNKKPGPQLLPVDRGTLCPITRP